MSVIIELTKNPNLMWFVSFVFLAITFATWRVSQNNNKWKIIYEISKYLTAGSLLFIKNFKGAYQKNLKLSL